MSDPIQIMKQEEETQPAQQRKKKKLHVIIACGYIGTNYNGSQMQNGQNALVARTIEGEIAKALIQLGYCPADDMKQLDFERSSRTDSKVSAAMTLFTFWANNAETIDQELNQILPPEIRIFGCQRTTPRFNCRVMCTSRRYIYVLPLEMCKFNPKFTEKLQDFKQFLEEQKQNEHLMARPELMTKIIDFSDPSKLIENLNEVSKYYTQQTNYYYNFITDAKELSMNQTQRKYEQFEFTTPITRNNQEFSVVEIHGTSFNYNQIRKMIAAVCMVARGQCPVTWLFRALSGKVEFKTDIPVAPGQYLTLNKPEFKGNEHSDEAKMYGTILCQREEIIQKSEVFKQQIFDEICKTEVVVWEKFVATMDEFAEQTNGFELAKQTVLRDIEIGKILINQKVAIEVKSQVK